MIPDGILSVLEELIPIYKKVVLGEYAIAIAGAHAKGKADIHSDLDIFVYAQDVCSFENRRAVFEAIADSRDDFWISEDIVSFPWGGSIDFKYKGYKVETTVRSIDKTNEVIDECISGKFRIYPETWTMNGYFSYIYLSEINFIKPVEDPYNIIKDLKEKVKIYPPALKKAIINQFMQRSNFWLDNFHYLSAIKRMDILYTSRIISNTMLDMAQILFALNNVYFTGDKKIELHLQGLDFCPKSLLDNMEMLLTAKRDIKYLEQQREILIEIAEAINEEVKTKLN